MGGIQSKGFAFLSLRPSARYFRERASVPHQSPQFGAWLMADSPHVGVVVPYATFLERRQRRERIAIELKQGDRPMDTPDGVAQPDPVDPDTAPRLTEVR